MSRTPGPWEIHDGGRFGTYGDFGPSICASTGEHTCQPLFEMAGPADAATCKENAEFVVLACNAHERLVEDLKYANAVACEFVCATQDVVDPENAGRYHTERCLKARAFLAELGEG